MRFRMTILGTASLLALAVLAESNQPRVAPFVLVPVQGPPACLEDFAADSSGTFWLADRTRGVLRNYRLEGGVLKRPALGATEIRVDQPTRIGLFDRGIAAVEGSAAVVVCALPSGQIERRIPVPLFNPAAGFLMTSVRIIFLGEGFQGCRPKPDRPYEAMTPFSVRLDGTGLSVMKKEVVQPSQSVAFDLFADGYSAPWPRKDHWAVCRALPRKVMIVDSMGQVEAESDAMGVLPAWPERVAEERLPQVQARWSTPHVVGLVPAGPRLGVVWQQPPSSGSQFRVEWMDENLKVAGESAFNLPRQLDPMSFVQKVSVGPDGRIYILVVKRELASPGISTLYASTLIAP